MRGARQQFRVHPAREKIPVHSDDGGHNLQELVGGKPGDSLGFLTGGHRTSLDEVVTVVCDHSEQRCRVCTVSYREHRAAAVPERSREGWKLANAKGRNNDVTVGGCDGPGVAGLEGFQRMLS